MYLGTAETNRRYAAALAELQARGVIHTHKIAPFNRLLEWFGFEPRPVPFLSWKQSLLIFTLGFAIAQLIVDPLLSWTTGLSFGFHTVELVISALIFGGIMAVFQVWRQHKLGLSDWEQL
ncbi:hypothetical protein DL1_19290 [Thioclava dalianensis]|uniref:Uncharacterized protein n=2 Tax=Thioclava dalianensis TaxID=1185766 RepID=A0A074TMU9_9RHOB|nr:DUF6404 family protein [Thioclava dalianensis]KEP70288.1 hypothetical protein DL1_19290 [Thioclava dalianensis]SFM83119.1 hypothetical protein SAMN05216224_101516 [Thioclava dalianensis]